MITSIIQIIFSVLLLVAVAYIFFSKNILYALYASMATFFCIAILFISMKAEYVAVSQVMVYVGGILILLLYGIMLGGNRNEALAIVNVNKLWGAFLSILVFVSGVFFVRKLPLDLNRTAVKNTGVKEIGMSLMQGQLLTFEVLGLLLLIALIGSTLLATKDLNE